MSAVSSCIPCNDGGFDSLLSFSLLVAISELSRSLYGDVLLSLSLAASVGALSSSSDLSFVTSLGDSWLDSSGLCCVLVIDSWLLQRLLGG